MAERLTSFDQIKPPIQFAYFDLGGVVLSFHNGIKDMAQKLNQPEPVVREYWLSRDDELCRGELAPQQFWIDLVSHFGTGDENMDFLTFWSSHFDSISETRQAMEDIRKRGVGLGILTNIYSGIFYFAVTSGVVPPYDYLAIVKSCEIGIVKPDPKIFEHAEHVARVKPKEIVFIDDRAENTDIAHHLGWNTLTYSSSRN
ncbi:MAG: HAD-IA family hydrolase [Candidatus Pacebacteria bacterium]|nr:HAD-IA family hydrolase [Candidatus Paceibacterota bacterium]